MTLLPNQNYDDLNAGMAALRIRTGDSPITLYVQHPIKIPAPGDKDKAEIKPLILTKKEQKKMRKQRRQAPANNQQQPRQQTVATSQPEAWIPQHDGQQSVQRPLSS